MRRTILVLAALSVAVGGCTMEAAATGSTPTEARTAVVDFEAFAERLDEPVELDGDEFSEQGVSDIAGAPVSEYCADAGPAIHLPGHYRAPTGFLTTQSPGRHGHCNGIPLEFTFTTSVQMVTISFWGAQQPYRLEGFDTAGNSVALSTEHALPYDYDDEFVITIRTDAPIIDHITFGEEASLTMLRSIEFGPPPGPSTELPPTG